MSKNNKSAEKVIKQCGLCGLSYWQKDLVIAKQEITIFDVKGEGKEKKITDILICSNCKVRLDNNDGVGDDNICKDLPAMRL